MLTWQLWLASLETLGRELRHFALGDEYMISICLYVSEHLNHWASQPFERIQ